jgi:putative glycosyltransferase (TIGR04372 family)
VFQLIRLYKIKRLVITFLVSIKVFKEMLVTGVNYFIRRDISLLGKILDDVYLFCKEIPLYYVSKKSFKNEATDTFSNYLETKRIADDYYQNGEWEKAKSYLIQAQNTKSKYYESEFKSHVRFIGPSITSSLGHMAISLNLRAKNNLLHPEFYQDYVILAGDTANDSYLSLWRNHFNLVKVSQFDKSIIEKAFWLLSESVETAPVRHEYLVLGDAHNNLTVNWESTNNGPILELNDEIMSTGRNWISKYGVREKDWFVTLHVRNNKYDRQGYGRNAEIDNYLPAIKEVIDSGGFVVVIGDNSKAKYLPELEGLINYSSMKFRSSILDTYFLAENEFLIATTSGPMNVPITFGKRILATNAPDIGKFVYYPGSIMIPKLVTKDGNVLSFKEMLNSKAGWSDSYIGPNLCWRDNSEDEIKEAVREMISADKEYFTNEINNVQKFNSIFHEYSDGPSTTISRYFLNKWQKLL